jgi:hypothetical protein
MLCGLPRETDNQAIAKSVKRDAAVPEGKGKKPDLKAKAKFKSSETGMLRLFCICLLI